MSDFTVSLQLWSANEACKENFINVLSRVAEMGYDGVELAGIDGLSKEELKANLERLSLKVVGAHISIDLLLGDLERVLEYNSYIGNTNLVIPWTSMKNKEENIELSEKIRSILPAIKERGFTLSYHNHTHEFKKQDGDILLDHLFSIMDKDELSFQPDTCWVLGGGEDPIEYMKKYEDRISLVHLKDMTESGGRVMKNICEGIVPIKDIVAFCKERSIKNLIIEIENEYPRDELKDAEISLNNLRAIL